MTPLLQVAGFVLVTVTTASCTTTTGDAACPLLVKYDGHVYIGLSSDDQVPGDPLDQGREVTCEQIEDGGDPTVIGERISVARAGNRDPRDAVAVKLPVGWRTYEVIRPGGLYAEFNDAADS